MPPGLNQNQQNNQNQSYLLSEPDPEQKLRVQLTGYRVQLEATKTKQKLAS